MTLPETTPGPAEPGFLRDRMAAGRSCVCPHPTDEHSLYGCTHGCACEWLPKPAPVDRPAVLREGADAIDAETRLAKERQILEPDKFRPCRDASAQLRRLAVDAQQPEAVAHRTLTEWIAEVLEDDGMWMYLGTGPDRSVAERRRASVTRRHPDAETRTVRKTTTYTVVAADAQDPVPADQGVPVCDIEATTGIAAAAVREAYGIGEEVALPGDALAFSVEAGRIVIAFTHHGPQA